MLPEAEEVEVEIKPEDLRIDVFRSSGPGGQSVNTTDSAVRITHLPTGLVVSCQDEKSQHKNKAKALRILRARLKDRMEEEQAAKRASERKGMVGTGDRSERIRTYNFPQNRVTDHRIGLTLHRLESFLEGDIQEMIDALTAHYQAEALERGRGVTTAVAEALALGRARLAAAGIAAADLEARVLLEHASGLDRAALIARGASRSTRAPASATSACSRGRRGGRPSPTSPASASSGRCGSPWTRACSCRAPRPRPSSRRPSTGSAAAPRVADVGTGSGAVAIALAVELPAAAPLGDRPLARGPRAGARERRGARGRRAHRVPRGRPRRAAGARLRAPSTPSCRTRPTCRAARSTRLEPEVRDHEPRLALDGGADGLAVIARLIAQAPRAAAPGRVAAAGGRRRAGRRGRGAAARRRRLGPRRDRPRPRGHRARRGARTKRG